MLNDILDLCIEKSNENRFYSFFIARNEHNEDILHIKKMDDINWVIRSMSFTMDELEQALEIMENE